jgi:hypothetical protein
MLRYALDTFLVHEIMCRIQRMFPEVFFPLENAFVLGLKGHSCCTNYRTYIPKVLYSNLGNVL